MPVHGWGSRSIQYSASRSVQSYGPVNTAVTPGGTGFQPTDASFVRTNAPTGFIPRRDRFMQSNDGKVWLIRDNTRWHVPDVETLHRLREEHRELGLGAVGIVKAPFAAIARNREVSAPPPRG